MPANDHALADLIAHLCVGVGFLLRLEQDRDAARTRDDVAQATAHLAERHRVNIDEAFERWVTRGGEATN